MPTIVIIMIVALIFINSIAKVNQQKKRNQSQQTAQRDPQHNTNAAQLDAQRRAAAEAEQRRRGTMAPRVSTTVQPSGAGWQCVCGRDNTAGAEYCIKCGRKRAEAMGGSIVYNSNEGGGLGGSLAYASTQGATVAGNTEGYSTEGRGTGNLVTAKSKLHHTVRPGTESRHSHTESSMTGLGEPCTEDYDPSTHNMYEQKGDAYSQKAGDSYAQNPGDSYAQRAGDAYAIGTDARGFLYGLKLDDANDIARGILYAEILSKPKALRGR